MAEINIGNQGGKVTGSKISIDMGGDSTHDKAVDIVRPALPISPGNTPNVIDKYIVPIYEREGIAPVIIILCALLIFVLLMVYLGAGSIIVGLLK